MPQYQIIIEELKHPTLGYGLGSFFTAVQILPNGQRHSTSFYHRADADQWIRQQHTQHLLQTIPNPT